MTGVELTDDLAEPRVGQGISEEDQPTEECKDRWAETNQSADREQRGLICSGALATKPPNASA